MKTISFVRARLEQMASILISDESIISTTDKEQLIRLGFGNFTTPKSSTDYLKNLWHMTEEYAQETLKFFETLVAENTQKELRLLQQFVVAGALIGFFGMNIPYPWQAEWATKSDSSFIVVILIFVLLFLTYFVLSQFIHRRQIHI